MSNTIKPNIYFTLASVVLGITFAGINPAPSDTLIGFGIHLVHWLFQAVGLMVFLIGLQHVMGRFGWARQKLSPWQQCILVGFATPWLFAPFGFISDVFFAMEPWPDDLLQAYFDEIGGMTLPVVVVWVGLQAPFLLGYGLNLQQPPTKKTAFDDPLNSEVAMNTPDFSIDANQASTFYKLLPKDCQEILAISSELHYISVQTLSAKHLILYSLKDAMNEIQIPGIQCHRSHWVSHKAIKAFHQQGRQGEIELIHGARLPVSRSRLSEVKVLVENLNLSNSMHNISKTIG